MTGERDLAARVLTRLRRWDPFWSAQATVLVAIVLGFALPAHLTVGQPWIVPALEAVLFAGLVVATPRPPTDHRSRRRALRIGLVSVVSAVNVVSLFLLARLLVDGAHVDGRPLLKGGVVLWLTTVLLFALWYSELDRGGPVRRLLHLEEEWYPPDWEPQMIDYMCLSLMNAAAFSPAETIPVSRVAKVLMSIRSLTSLATLVIVLAYAVNNLG